MLIKKRLGRGTIGEAGKRGRGKGECRGQRAEGCGQWVEGREQKAEGCDSDRLPVASEQ